MLVFIVKILKKCCQVGKVVYFIIFLFHIHTYILLFAAVKEMAILTKAKDTVVVWGGHCIHLCYLCLILLIGNL